MAASQRSQTGNISAVAGEFVTLYETPSRAMLSHTLLQCLGTWVQGVHCSRGGCKALLWLCHSRGTETRECSSLSISLSRRLYVEARGPSDFLFCWEYLFPNHLWGVGAYHRQPTQQLNTRWGRGLIVGQGTVLCAINPVLVPIIMYFILQARDRDTPMLFIKHQSSKKLRFRGTGPS